MGSVPLEVPEDPIGVLCSPWCDAGWWLEQELGCGGSLRHGGCGEGGPACLVGRVQPGGGIVEEGGGECGAQGRGHEMGLPNP